MRGNCDVVRLRRRDSIQDRQVPTASVPYLHYIQGLDYFWKGAGASCPVAIRSQLIATTIRDCAPREMMIIIIIIIVL